MGKLRFAFALFFCFVPAVGNPKPSRDIQNVRNVGRKIHDNRFQSSANNSTDKTETAKKSESYFETSAYIDIRRFGAYFGSDPARVTASCVNGSSSVRTNAPGDYLNGQGVVIYNCGPLPSLKTPSTPMVTANVLNGSTTWNYRVVAEDYSGGYTAAGPVGISTIGPAQLGLTSFEISSAARSNGVSTYTTKSAHNLELGSEIYICGFGGATCAKEQYGDVFNGTKIVASVPSAETFTVNDGAVPDTDERPASAKLWSKACNTLTFAPGTTSGYDRMLRYWIYRSRGGGLFALAGVAIGLDPFFVDCGGRAPTSPPYIPPTPPTRPGAGYLSTTILSGSGTTNFQLAERAGNTTNGSLLVHDNSSALLAAMKEAQNQSGGTIYIPSVSPGNGFWDFNATTDMTRVGGRNYVTVLVNGNIALNQPWILGSNLRIEGMTRHNSSFMYPGGARFGSVGGYPMLYAKKQNSIVLQNLFINCGGAQCTDLFTDTDGGGNGSVGIIAENVGFGNSGNGNVGTARNVIIKGGFDYFFRQVTCEPATGLTTYLPEPCLNFTDSSPAVESASQIAGRVKFDNYYTSGSGIRIDSVPNKNGSGPAGYYFYGVLAESMLTPFLRIGPIQQPAGDFHINDLVMADQIAGSGTPLVDVSGTRLATITVAGGIGTQAGGQPVVIGSAGYGPTLFSLFQPTLNSGNTRWFALRQTGVSSPGGAGAAAEINDQPFNAVGSGRFNYAMLSPLAPASCALVAGGKAPVGEHAYTLTAVDYDGNETLPGAAAKIHVPGGQSVKCLLPALPTGAVGFNVYRDGFRILVGGTCKSPQVASGFLNDVGSGCGTSVPAVNGAGSSSMSREGLASHQIRLSGEIFTASPRSILPAVLIGPLTSRWTAARWTPDKPITITRIELETKSAPSGCSTNAVVSLSDGANSIYLSVSGQANDSGPISQNYRAGTSLTLSVHTPAAGCANLPADANVVIQYRMQ